MLNLVMCREIALMVPNLIIMMLLLKLLFKGNPGYVEKSNLTLSENALELLYSEPKLQALYSLIILT